MTNTNPIQFAIGPTVLLVLLSTIALATRPLMPIDETRYVSVAWEMWLRHDYLVLFKNGAPYSDKPPLLFWLYNLGWTVFGVNEFWPRLVSPLFSLGGLSLTLSIARRLWPDDAGAARNAPWILASSLLWIVFSTSAMFDVMLAFIVLVGVRGLLVAASESMLRGFAWLGLAIGLGVLAKGPVILLHLLPVALLAPWWRSAESGSVVGRRRWYLGILLAVFGGAAIALMWALPAAMRGGEQYRHAIFWGQTADRMVDSFAHKRAFWWYLPLLPLLLFPWSAWPCLWRRFATLKRDRLDNGLRFCLAWAVPVSLALSLISGKQMHYLVPLFPAFALFSGRLSARANPGAIWFPALLASLIGVAMAYCAVNGLPAQFAAWSDLPIWPGVALALTAAALGWSGRAPNRRIASIAMLGAAVPAMIHLYVSERVTEAFDIRPVALQIRQLQDRGIPIANTDIYHAQFQFAGRLEKPLDLVDWDAIPLWLAKHPNGVVVAYSSRKNQKIDALFSQPYRGDTVALLRADQVPAYFLKGHAD